MRVREALKDKEKLLDSMEKEQCRRLNELYGSNRLWNSKDIKEMNKNAREDAWNKISSAMNEAVAMLKERKESLMKI